MVNGDELGAVGKGTLDLHFLEHLGHSFHHVVTTEDGEPGLHQLRDAPSVADALEDLGRDERQRLRSEEHTSELQSRLHLVCRLLLEKKKRETAHYCYVCYTRLL